MRHTHRRRFWFVGLLLLALVAAACSADASSGGSDSLSMKIGWPADGTRVADPFTVKFDANVPLDEPSTGEHHVHLCYDGADCDAESEYELVYGDSFEVDDLAPGEHTIEASLRNADHSDAGPSHEISVIVGGGGASSEGGTDSDGSTESDGGDTGGGYDY